MPASPHLSDDGRLDLNRDGVLDAATPRLRGHRPDGGGERSHREGDRPEPEVTHRLLPREIVVGADHGYGIGAGPITRNATGLQEAADTLHAIVEPGDVVLVKASRAAGLERLALRLIEESAS